MMLRARAAAPLLGWTALIMACHGGSRPPSPEGAQRARALAAADSALARPVSAQLSQQVANLTGAWALRVKGQTGRGPLLELALDSVTATTFRVRVTFLMSGNVGIDPARFETTTGTVAGDGSVHLSVKMRAQSDSLGQMAGVLGQDTIRLRAFRWAGENQMTGGMRWVLVRERER
jgi:hypothetical protein